MRLNLSSSRQLAAVVAILVGGVTDVVQAAPSAAERQLNQVLQRRVTISWQGQQLGRAVARLAASQQVVVWLDRRVDPEQRVNLQLRDVRVDAALAALAAEFDLGIARLGGIIYLGPQQAARELPALADRTRTALAGVPARTRRRWLRAAPSDWPRRSEPRALLATMLADSDLELLDGARVPHDLWAATRMPAMALIDRVVLLLVGFDLTCDVTGSGDCRVVSIRRPVTTTTRSGGSTKNVGRRASVPANDLERVFSLRLQRQAVGRVVEQLAAQLELEIVWDKSLDPAVRDTRVSCDVQNVQLTELLESVLHPAGLRAELEENRIEIRAAE